MYQWLSSETGESESKLGMGLFWNYWLRNWRVALSGAVRDFNSLSKLETCEE